MMRSVGCVVRALKAIDQRDGCGQIERAAWEHGVEQQAGLRDGEHGFFSITAKAASQP